MGTDPPPIITSFVIRFVHPDQSVELRDADLRGSIRHVQSDQEILFTRWPDAVAFIQRFVPVDSCPKLEG